MTKFDAFRRKHPLLQHFLCMFGLHLWEPRVFFDWCDHCQTPRD